MPEQMWHCSSCNQPYFSEETEKFPDEVIYNVLVSDENEENFIEGIPEIKIDRLVSRFSIIAPDDYPGHIIRMENS
jgi:hypothetical protein